jgi:hypothetical protein
MNAMNASGDHCAIRREGEDVQLRDPFPRKQRCFVAQRGETRGGTGRCQPLARVGFEGEHRRGELSCYRTVADQAQQRLVSAMDAIEIADGERGRCKAGRMAPQDAHRPLSLLSENAQLYRYSADQLAGSRLLAASINARGRGAWRSR